MMTKKIFLVFLFILICLPIESARVEIECSPTIVTAFQGEKVILTFRIKNNQIISLRPGEGYFLSYHIYDQKGNLILFENQRFILPRVLRKKTTTEFKFPFFFSYHDPGQYTIEFDLVREGKFWGADKKWKTARIQLNLKSLFSPEFKKRYYQSRY